MTDIDYRALLLRYIAYVVKKEGVDYIPRAGDDGWFKTAFTEDERAELRRLSDEANGVTLPEPTDEDYD